MCFVCDPADIDNARKIWKECGGRGDQPLAFVVVGRLPRGAVVEWQIWAHRESHSEVKSYNTDYGTISVIRKTHLASLTYHLSGKQ